MSDAHPARPTTPSENLQGPLLLASGEHVALRLWDEMPADTEDKTMHTSPYETVGYVLTGEAVLHLDGDEVTLRPGDSWLVPRGTAHRYRVTEHFRALEATSPPATHA